MRNTSKKIIASPTEQLKESELRYRRLFETAQDGILILNAKTGAIDDVNPYLIDMLGYSRDEFLNKKLWEVGAFEDVSLSKTLFKILQRDKYIRYENLPLKKRNGQLLQVEFISNVYPVNKKQVIQCNIRDISKRKRDEEILRNLSLVDELTGLYNRRGFLALAEQAFKLAKRKRRCMILLFFDVDSLKKINDTLGHLKGDQALIETATILKETFREADVIARLGGDEFVVLAIETASEQASTLLNRLQKNLDLHNEEADRQYKLSLSSGFARYNPDEPSSLSYLLAQSDSFIYQEKQTKYK